MKMSNRIFKAAITLSVMCAMLFSWSLWPSVQGASQKTQGQKAQTLTQSRQDEAQKAIQEGILGRIAAKANDSLRNYPSPSQIRNIANPKVRAFVERVRNLLEAGKAANRWNATQLRDFASQVDRYVKEGEAAVISAKDNDNDERTPQEKCGQALERCRNRCDAEDGGYFCYFDCRLEYVTCLADTIIS